MFPLNYKIKNQDELILYSTATKCFIAENLRFIKDTGVLEMYYNNKWMFVSYGYKWVERNSKVICRQLGLPTYVFSINNFFLQN